MVYWLTIDADILSFRIERPGALSLLFCPDFDCRWDAHYPVDPSPLSVVAHESSPRARAAHPGVEPFEGRRLTLSPIQEETSRPTELSKLGGKPGYVQRGAVGREYEAKGLEFLLQIDDTARLKGYRSAFSHGTVYVFTRIEGDRLTTLAAFYESS